MDALAAFFQWQQAPAYNGSTDALEWLDDIEEEMERLGYRPSDYVTRASEKLESEAKTWYRAWKILLQGPLLWDNFKASFLDQFSSSSSHDWDEQLLFCVQQCDESVTAYSNRFVTLAWRAKRLTDPSLVHSYVRGLHKSVSAAMRLFRSPTDTLQQAIQEAAKLGKCDWRAFLGGGGDAASGSGDDGDLS